jgi:general secretion pathway protein K
MTPPSGVSHRSTESGAALLTALVIVAALSALAALLLEDMGRSRRLDANLTSQMQAQWQAVGADAYARSISNRLDASGELTSALAAGGVRASFPLEQGLLSIEAQDASACINLNSVVSGVGDTFALNATGAAQLRELLTGLGAPAGQAEELVGELVRWMDTASSSSAITGDDLPYRQGPGRYLTGGEPLAEVSELRAVRGVTPEMYALLRPHVCALPVTGPSPVNINVLRPDQGRILSALLMGRISESQAQDILKTRPSGGWTSLGDFFGQEALRGLDLPEELMQAVALRTRYINLTAIALHLDAEVVMSELLVWTDGGFRPLTRRWSEAP